MCCAEWPNYAMQFGENGQFGTHPGGAVTRLCSAAILAVPSGSM